MVDGNYSGQEGASQTNPPDLSRMYALLNRSRKTDNSIPLSDEFRELLELRLTEGSVVAANILALEGFQPVLDGEVWEYKPAKRHEPKAFTSRIKSTERVETLLGQRGKPVLPRI